ncbi:MAG TPA: HEAT repeat domain-containing protein [Pirellulaceae bacterium]|nr:HEAT repeat domain-containing protein [Pirellulaceae bacterium]
MATAFLFFLVSAPVAWGQAAAAPPTAEEIAAAIGRLGDDSFDVRQKATEWLWQAGPAAETQLRAALKSTDPEVRTRAASVLDKIRFGLRPDTPPDVAILIDQFRHAGSAALRRQALTALQDKGQWAVILSLVRRETDPNERRNLATAISADAGKLLRPLLAKGDFDQAEQVLELTAVNEAGLTQLATFLLLTQRLESQIEAVRQRLAADPQEDEWRRLALYLRAKGDFTAAADAAQKAGDALFAAKVLAESGRFAEAAVAAQSAPKGSGNRSDADAFAAAYFDLARDETQFQRTIELLKQAANIDKIADKPQPIGPADPFGQPASSPTAASAWRLAEALLIAERVEEGLAVLKKTHPVQAHALLMRQHRHHDALEFVGVTAEKKLDRAWLDSLPGGLGDVNQQLSVRFGLAAQVARQLRELGRIEQTKQIAETLRAIAAAEGLNGFRWSALATLHWQLDQYDEAFAALEQALASGQQPASAFTGLARTQASLAAAWFTEITTRDPLADRKAAIAQAIWLVTAQPPAGKLPANWRDLVERSAAEARKLPQGQRGANLMLPADIIRVRGDLPLARKLYEEGEEDFAAATRQAADVAAALEDWPAAAAKYGKLAGPDNSDLLVVYLHGHALTKTGQEKEGKESLRLASLTALAPDVRYAIALGLQERGLKELAAEQFEIVRRTALPDSSISVNAAQRVGNLVNEEQPQRACDCWRQLHLHILNSNSNFLEAEGYLSLPQIMHKVRARAALAGGKAEEVAAELERCEKLLPGDVRLTVDLTPKLDGAGLRAIADQVFERSIASHRRVLEEFPGSPTFLNNAAWICARAQRQLDEGLALAERAVKAAPDEGSYHDTLAEVHFQRGDRDAAVAAARKAAELSPENKLFAKRLKHFQEDPVKTLDSVNE